MGRRVNMPSFRRSKNCHMLQLVVWWPTGGKVFSSSMPFKNHSSYKYRSRSKYRIHGHFLVEAGRKSATMLVISTVATPHHPTCMGAHASLGPSFPITGCLRARCYWLGYMSPTESQGQSYAGKLR